LRRNLGSPFVRYQANHGRRLATAGMSKREAQYRGYNIEVERRGREFRISITPGRPELPVLHGQALSPLVPTWEGAFAEAQRRIDQALST
jgi:hypothetical protein